MLGVVEFGFHGSHLFTKTRAEADKRFMTDFNDRLFVFSGATFTAALEEWTAEQITAYPQQEDLIRITALAMRDFMASPQAKRHKMGVPGARSVP